MNKLEFEKLIEKYYKGETSLEEEEILHRYYNEDYAGRPNVDQVQFLYFNAERNENPGSHLSAKLESSSFSDNRPKQINFNFVVRIAAVLILGIGIGWFLYRTEYHSSKHKITTRSGEQTNLKLPDGSTVWLNGMTEFEYDDTFDLDKREVYLKGEAYFEVVKNSIKPFIVHTGKVTTEVLGTSFNLRSYSQEESIELSVVTGKVNFGKTKIIEVRSGTQAYFNASKDSIKTLEASLNAVAWRTKQLIFEDALMSHVIHDLERYFNTRFEIETPGLLNCHFKGNFRDPQLEDILKVIGYSLNIRYSLRNGSYFLQGQNCEAK